MITPAFKINLEKYKNIFVLTKVKWFFLKELVWFFLSIIVIASLFTLSIGFLIGLESQEIFISENDDVLIISENTLSPTLSRVPSYWVEDINKISGVKSISPETIDIVLDETNHKPVFLRGVTDNYQEIEESFHIEEGNWFNSSLINQIIIGEHYAEIYNLHIGNQILVNSRTRNIFQNLLIVGIFSTESASEDGIIGSIALGKLMSNLQVDYINIIRVKFNINVITKEILHDIVFNKHEIKIRINDVSNNSNDPQFTKVNVFSRTKELINSSLISITGETTFYLPFGTYFFQLEHPDIIFKSNFIEKFIIQTDSFQIDIGKKEYKFTSQIRISGTPVSNTEVIFTHLEGGGNISTFTNETGYVDTLLYEGLINVTINWKNFLNNQLIIINRSEVTELDFEFINQIEVLNSQSIHNFEEIRIQLFDYNNSLISSETSIEKNLFNVSLIPKNQYKIVLFGKIDNKLYSREINHTYTEKIVPPIFLGPKSVTIYATDSLLGFHPNKSLNVWLKSNGTQYIFSLTTNSTGYVRYLFANGDEVSIELRDDLRGKTIFENYLIDDQDLITIKSGDQQLKGQLYSYISGINKTDLSDFQVKIFNRDKSVNLEKLVNTNGTFQFSLPYDLYTISVASGVFKSEFYYNFSNYTGKSIFIPIDSFYAQITFINYLFFPITGTIKLNKLQTNFWVSEINTNNSELNLNLTFGDYQIIFENEAYYYESIIRIDSDVNLNIIVPYKFPNIAIKGNISNSYIKGGESLNITGNHISGLVFYKWDNTQEWSNTTLPNQIIIPLINGIHDLAIKASNNENKTLSKVITYIIVTLGPELTLLNSQNRSFVEPGFIPHFSFTYSPSNVLYRWDNQINTSLPLTIPNVKGNHTLTVSIEVPFKINVEYFYLFTLDNDYPMLYSDIDIFNNSFIQKGLQVNFSFSENITLFQYFWNINSYNVTSSLIIIPLNDGFHNLTIRITDKSGKVSFYHYFLKVNDTSPTIQLLSPSNNSVITTQGSNVYFNVFDYWGNVSYSWNSSFKIKTMYYMINISLPNENGTHFLNIYCENIFSRITNITYVFHSIYTKISLYSSNFVNNSYIKPNSPLLFHVNNHNGSILLFWNNNPPNSTYSLDNFTVNAPSSEGLHKLVISLSNSTLWENRTYYLVIDDTSPIVYILNTNNGSILNNSFLPLLDFSEPIFFSNYFWDDQENSTILRPMPGGDTYHNLTITVEDFAGNQGQFFFQYYRNSKSINLRLDQVGNYSVLSKNSIVEVLVDKSLKSLLCSWDNNIFNNCSFLLELPVSHGFHNISIIAEDNYGMVSNKYYVIFIDNSPPFIVNSFPENNSILTNTTFSFTFSEQIITIIYNWSGIGSNSTGYPEILPELSGNSSLSIYIEDQANNWNLVKLNYFIDLKPAELMIYDSRSITNDIYYTSVNKTLRIEINDISHMDLISYRWNSSINSTFTNIGKISEIVSPNVPGFYRLELVTLDEAKNWGNYSIFYYVAQNWFEFLIRANESDIKINTSVLLLKDFNNNTIYNNTFKINIPNFISVDNITISTVSLQFNNNLFSASIFDIINKTFHFELVQINLELKNLETGIYSNGNIKITMDPFISDNLNIDQESPFLFLTFKGNNKIEATVNNPIKNLIRITNIDKSLSIVIPTTTTSGYINLRTDSVPISDANIFLDGLFIGKTNVNGLIPYTINPGGYNILIKLTGGTEFNIYDQFWEIETKNVTINPKSTLNAVITSETGIGLENVKGVLYNNDKSSILVSKYSNWQGLMSFERLSFGIYFLELTYPSSVITKEINIDRDNNLTVIFKIPSTDNNIFGDVYKKAKWYNYNSQGSIDIFYSNELSDEIFDKLGFSVAFYAILIIIIGTTVLALIISVKHPVNIALKRFRAFFLLGASLPQVIISVTLQTSLISIIVSFIGNIFGILLTYVFPQLRSISIGGLIINSEVDLLILMASSTLFGVVIFATMIISLKGQLSEIM